MLLSAAAAWSGLSVLPAWALELPAATRLGPGEMRITWTATAPVDVYMSVDPAADLSHTTVLARGVSSSHYEFKVETDDRPYFILRDTVSGETLRVAERIAPLERGSNFRDLGGYRIKSGQHVRWGLIYRGAAMPC
jgi:protein-tyrosine phosphatase